jgi:hypothetical protein
VGLGPGVVRILRSWGVHLERAGAQPVLGMDIWSGPEGKLLDTKTYNAVERAGENVVSPSPL